MSIENTRHNLHIVELVGYENKGNDEDDRNNDYVDNYIIILINKNLLESNIYLS